MSPAIPARPPDTGVPSFWGQVYVWVARLRPLAWAASMLAGVIVFFVVVPVTTRLDFWYGLRAQRTLTSMLFVFTLLAISLLWSAGQRVDAWAFLLLNLRGPRPIWLDRVMLGFTWLGSGIAALGIAVALFLAGDHPLSYELMVGTLALWPVVELLKALVRRSRPLFRLSQTRIVGFPALGTSFPSGHTSQAFFMATLVTRHLHVNAWLGPLLYATALFVGITRMYVGAHYPRDVLAGIILGSAWGLLWGIVDGYVQVGIG